MITEVAVLDVKPLLVEEFQQAFKKAQAIISAMDGYIDHQLQRCIEDPNRFILIVNWHTLQAHTEGFRESEQYQEWKASLHHFYDPFPTVEHYEPVFSSR
ncbi:antibiotic biosynthesis monooxygenase family protein [Vibrio genomosp. F10]|uniref:Antibiotic biosynthesis monooxygenase n=1 Tax=Vibrio genomosp. F10 TaxID=723171 RepID=A0A1B9R0C1_9VIBR|nr:antibiotic biosynthesis monooxygenase [Vibrio genomosp. F10]OCH77342.1 antibiotic biosynthesis monooxygenase [Vibrio genomosp. F10]